MAAGKMNLVKRGRKELKRYKNTKRENRLVQTAVKKSKTHQWVVESIANQELSTTSGNTPICLSDAISRAVTSPADRTSDRLRINGMDLSFRVYPKATNYSTCTCRVMLVQWRQDSALSALNNINKVLYDSGTSPYIHSFEIRQDPDFKIIWDSGVFTVGPFLDAAAGVILGYNSKAQYVKEFTIKGKHFNNLRFNAGADTGSNHIYLMYMSDIATGTNTAQIDGKFRLRFQDA